MGTCGVMSIRQNKAFCLMVLIKHVISILLSHMKSVPSVIPDVCNRESKTFPCWTFPSLPVRHHGSHHSEVMLPLPEGYDSLLNSRENLF